MITLTRFVTTVALVTTIACAGSSKTQPRAQADAAAAPTGTAKGGRKAMQIHYLEIVTKDVDAVCAAYAAANGVEFGKPDAGLGNARTAPLPGGGLVGVRAPLRANEEPIVRPYWLVDDIEDEDQGQLIQQPEPPRRLHRPDADDPIRIVQGKAY
jgi:hypothetical protein